MSLSCLSAAAQGRLHLVGVHLTSLRELARRRSCGVRASRPVLGSSRGLAGVGPTQRAWPASASESRVRGQPAHRASVSRNSIVHVVANNLPRHLDLVELGSTAGLIGWAGGAPPMWDSLMVTGAFTTPRIPVSARRSSRRDRELRRDGALKGKQLLGGFF